jgi:hypothetical protein
MKNEQREQQVKASALPTPPDLHIQYSEDVEPCETLPDFDTIHYIYYGPELEDEGDNDYYAVVGFKGGKGLFNTNIPAGRLKDVVGKNIADQMVLGQGAVTIAPNVVGVKRPWRSLVVHETELNEMDKQWLREMDIEMRKKAL